MLEGVITRLQVHMGGRQAINRRPTDWLVRQPEVDIGLLRTRATGA